MATVNLTWTDNASSEDGFRVYRTTTSSPSFPSDYSQIEELATPDTTSYTDSNAPDNEMVYYAVTAYNADGESDPTTNSIETPYPVTIDGEELTEITIDGETVTGLTVDGETLF